METRRVTLRPPTPDDLAALHGIFAHPKAMRHWSTPAHRTLDDTAELLARMIEAEAQLGPEWVIERGGVVIGRAGLWRRWEVGYILHPDHWGQGYASEALGAVLDEAFARHPDCDGITADIDPRNAASGRVLEKVGFVVTGEAKNTFCINGEWSDSTYFRRDRPTGS